MTFESWVKQHNPELDWDFDNVDKLRHQLIETVRGSGTLDIESIKSRFPERHSGRREQIFPLLLEAHELNGVEWGVSFGGSNPESDEYVAMNNKSDCVKLIDLINRNLAKVQELTLLVKQKNMGDDPQ